jgi:hypothetical protein
VHIGGCTQHIHCMLSAARQQALLKARQHLHSRLDAVADAQHAPPTDPTSPGRSCPVLKDRTHQNTPPGEEKCTPSITLLPGVRQHARCTQQPRSPGNRHFRVVVPSLTTMQAGQPSAKQHLPLSQSFRTRGEPVGWVPSIAQQRANQRKRGAASVAAIIRGTVSTCPTKHIPVRRSHRSGWHHLHVLSHAGALLRHRPPRIQQIRLAV